MNSNDTTRFVWFWTFWHWSREGFRAGALLRGPLPGIGSHWDEWFSHEASEEDRRTIADLGRSEEGQRRFAAWLFLNWGREFDPRGNRMAARFVVTQLSQLAPFNEWPALGRYRSGYGIGGVSAVVLAEGSPGRASDVRLVEAVALPGDSNEGGPYVSTDGFKAEARELDVPVRAAGSMLAGQGLLALLGLWVATGRRFYPRWLKAVLTIGWLAVAGTIALLLWGPEPGGRLPLLMGGLTGLWCGLVVMAATTAGATCFEAWRHGTVMNGFLKRSHVRLRMEGGLTLRGSSAGLPFCLNTLLALHRAHPGPGFRSRLWARFFKRFGAEGKRWAATGAVTEQGWVKSVLVVPKMRACLQEADIDHLLMPGQADATQRTVEQVAGNVPAGVPRSLQGGGGARGVRLGFAAQNSGLISHRCRHVGRSILDIGGLMSRWQLAANAFTLLVSATMVAALPDILSMLRPPPAPLAVAPSSPSPYQLWVSLDTRQAERFRVVFESDFWANRVAVVKAYGGADASVRAELPLLRVSPPLTNDVEDGRVRIERRRHFLFREYLPGECVGIYTLSYLTNLGYD